MNSGVGKTGGSALRGSIKTLLHNKRFEKCSFKTTSFRNNFRKESVVKSV